MSPSTPPPLPVAHRRSTDKLAVASLLLSIIGLIAFGIPALIGVIIGHISRSRIRRQAASLTGSGIALSGLIIGYVAVFFWSLALAGLMLQPYFVTLADTAVKDRALQHARDRQSFHTHLIRKDRENEPAAPPAPDTGMKLVTYPGPLGDMAAYVSADPADGKKHPAIIWLIGGFSNSISADVLPPGDPENDQSASAFRQAGLLMLYPSLRGGNTNPGFKEGLLGEADDVIAALAWLKQQPYIDPARIYLGGHSTGGTLALLVAGSTTGLRATVAFGAVHSTGAYGQDILPFDVENEAELTPRAPILCLDGLSSPTFIIEGEDGNIDALRLMRKTRSRRHVRFFEIPAADHFSILRPLSELLAKAMLADTGPTPKLTITDSMLQAAMKQR
ncbi:MAG: DUF4190 domain-containing protein [Prosthecobacter sp.]|uniref:DUF4190 domain-containing protein n=1 Tax=Prosthecobacter sp. TaxID=1965333 RepID=UPI0025FE7FD1|nr:DUF4190 domain-containing protein [Prosthecobacter sp.]MCF7787247.1 DUF4190 domain-containing protein [Prosthecobacter sp.]